MGAIIERPDVCAIDRSIVIDWQLSSYFAWGILGLNFVLNWSLQQRETMLTTAPINENVIDLNPLEWACIRPALEGSRSLQARLDPLSGQHVKINLPVVHALGNDLIAAGSSGDRVRLAGSPSIAMATFESTAIAHEQRERAKQYALVIVPSEWNRGVLERGGITNVIMTPEGVDPTTFHPAPRAGLFGNRFTVFSGGKLEHRKGQDLVIKAFRIFARRHADALLVTTWNSPWPQLAQTLNTDDSLAPIGFAADGRQLDITSWAVANGIPSEQFIAIGALPNSAMPRIYREMDVALFPNRCEGASNLVAMECMACGIPVILSHNTGHLDIMADDRAYALTRQAPLGGDRCEGWGESDIEEIVETLEGAYVDCAARLARGVRAAHYMRDRTWAHSTRLRAQAIAALL